MGSFARTRRTNSRYHSLPTCSRRGSHSNVRSRRLAYGGRLFIFSTTELCGLTTAQPFGHAAVTQMVQAIIRQFRCYLPEDNDEINFNNIVAFAVTMLRFALREFLNGTYNQSEFVVEDEETGYDEVLDRINELDGSDLEFYHLMIDHIFKLL